MADHTRILAFIEQCDDVEKLRTLIQNARRQGATQVADAAFKKLVALLPTERPGTVEHDFWQMVHAFEHLLTEERGKTTRLGRTRQMVGRIGVVPTLCNWAFRNRDTAGFQMLLDRGMPEFTGESIVLRHSGQFAPEVVKAAAERLTRAGVDVTKLARGP